MTRPLEDGPYQHEVDGSTRMLGTVLVSMFTFVFGVGFGIALGAWRCAP